jgi:hypothetical protein
MKKYSIISIILSFIFFFSTIFITTTYAKVEGIKVLIVADKSYNYKELANLLESEGFSVSILPGSSTQIGHYNVFIIGDSGSDEVFPSIYEQVKKGAGLLLVDLNYYVYKVFGLAGVVVALREALQPEWKDDSTSKIIAHPVTKGVRSISLFGSYLHIISSNAYPLIIGNFETWGVEDPVLAVASTYGQGRIIAIGGRHFAESHELSKGDNALFLKNAVYWLAGLDVPEFTHKLPTLISLKDEVSKLSENITRLNKDIAFLFEQLSKFEANIENMPEFISLKKQLSNIENTLNNFQSTLTEVKKENEDLRKELLQTKMLSYCVIAIAIVMILVSAITLFRKRKI